MALLFFTSENTLFFHCVIIFTYFEYSVTSMSAINLPYTSQVKGVPSSAFIKKWNKITGLQSKNLEIV